MDRYSEIAKIAYELYIRRQGEPGDPQTDWFVAERIFGERETAENQESSATRNTEKTAAAGSVKRTRVRAKSNGSSQPETVSSARSSVKQRVEKTGTQKTPRNKRSSSK